MQIIEEIKYQYGKLRDRRIINRLWLRKTHCKKLPVSKTILIIRLDSIGDCIIWLDQAKEYRKVFPNHRLVLLHNKVWSEIANLLPWFDECIPFDRTKTRDFSYYKHLLQTLNKYHYETMVSPVYSRDLLTVDWFVHNINAKEKIGYEGDYQNNSICFENRYYRLNAKKIKLKQLADSWYTSIVPNDNNCTMELQRNAHFFRQSFNHDFQSRLPVIPFNIPYYPNIPSSEYAVFFLGASTELRMWPVTSFVKVSHHIPYTTIVLCGSPQEKKLADTFISAYDGNKSIIDLTGKTSLINLISIISNAKIVITNETSASHIAVATRTPSICLLGGGHYGRFHPYQADIIDGNEKASLPVVVTAHNKSCFNCNWGCKYPLQNGRWKCIDDIQANDVIEAVDTKCFYSTPKRV